LNKLSAYFLSAESKLLNNQEIMIGRTDVNYFCLVEISKMIKLRDFMILFYYAMLLAFYVTKKINLYEISNFLGEKIAFLLFAILNYRFLSISFEN